MEKEIANEKSIIKNIKNEKEKNKIFNKKTQNNYQTKESPSPEKLGDMNEAPEVIIQQFKRNKCDEK